MGIITKTILAQVYSDILWTVVLVQINLSPIII